MSDAPEVFSPEKACRFFEHGKTAFDTGGYEYAMTHYLNGIGLDPTSMDGLKAFLLASDRFAQESGKKVSTRGVVKGLNSRKGVDKYISLLLSFGVKKSDSVAAVKVADAAGKLGLREPGRFLGEYALRLSLADPKVKKDALIKLLDLFEKIDAYELAAQTGDAATRLDPTDGQLQMRVRNMLARSTMSKGGFDDVDKEGGFHKNIRDVDKQLALEQGDQMSKSDSARDQQVERAKEDHDSRPSDTDALGVYAKALLLRAKPGDELKAMSLYNKAFKETQQFRFRQQAGDIQVRLANRSVKTLAAKADAAPDDTALAEKLASSREALRKLDLEELRLQVKHYPTDLNLKFKIGRAVFNQGEYNEAIELFQLAQDDPKNRARVLNYMGQAFLKLGGWDDAAVETFKRALEVVSDHSGELGMELRYGMMTALQAKSEHEQDLDSAEEAEKLAAGIAIQKFSYRDVRERRDQIKKLIAEMKG